MRQPMSIHAIKRAIGIIRSNPAKLLLMFTPTGWKKFYGLRREKVANDPVARAKFEALVLEKKGEFKSAAWRHKGGISQRNYSSYEEYVAHQKEKLDQIGGEAFVNSEKAINMFRRRFELVAELPKNASVICLGARRGEEVRAFVGLQHFAIGIDLNPGEGNRLVVSGDFHALQFSDSSVDCVYVNCLDHAFQVDKIMLEVHRVLKNGGLFITDLVYGYEEGFTVGNHDAMHWATAKDFAELLANISGLSILTFRDLASHGSPSWTQTVMRKI